MSGDDSIAAFDNARQSLKALLEDEGVFDDDIIELSQDVREQVGGVRSASVDGFEDAMLDLAVGADQGCLVFMTSHGDVSGFYLHERDVLTPSKLDQILDDACGEQPTVVLVSACFSGTFVAPLQAPNRIILTSSRHDRTSFGCAPDDIHPHWDGCLIDHFQVVDTWSELQARIVDCVESKEGAIDVTPSLPQAFFGDDVRELRVLYR